MSALDRDTEVVVTLDEYEELQLNVIRVRHDLLAYAKALLTTLGWSYVVDLDAPECAQRCRQCRAIDRRRAA